MIKTFFKNSFIYTFGTVLTRGIAIFLVPIYTRYLSPSEYGVIDIFIVIAAIINLTIALEISQAIARYYREGKNQKEKAEYVSSAFWFTVIVYLLYFFISWYFSGSLSLWLLDREGYKTVFILASVAITTNGIFYFTQNQLKWQMQSKDSVIVSMVNVVIIAMVAVYLLIVEEMQVESIFIGQILGNIVASGLAIYYAQNSYRFVFCMDKFKEMVTYSYPLVLSGIGVFIVMYIDRIAIKDLLGLEALGIYGIAFRFAAVASLVMIGFQQSLSPLVYKHYQEEDTPENISKIFNLFSLFALLVVAGSILFSKEVLVVLTTEMYYSASSLISLLVMAVFFSNMYIFAPGLGIAKKTKVIATITLLGALLNTVLNYTLIPVFGLSGAAYATLVSSVSIFIIYLFTASKYYKIPYKVIPLLISFGLALLPSYILLNMFHEIHYISVLYKAIYLLCLSILMAYLLVGKKYFSKFNFSKKKVL